MGRKQQQRRYKKKKADSATLKCTACLQIVSVDTSIACPVPECDRIFCTQHCSSTCILRCAAPDCPEPTRCRPCAFGRTFAKLERRRNNFRYETATNLGLVCEILQPCEADGCNNFVCGKCSYVATCFECTKMVCLKPCGDTEVLECTSCFEPFCRDCEPNLDRINSRCSRCILNVDYSSGDETTESEESVADDAVLQPWTMMEPSEIDEIVLEYANVLGKFLRVLVAYASSRPCSEEDIASSRLARTRALEGLSEEESFIKCIADCVESQLALREMPLLALQSVRAFHYDRGRS